MYGLAAGLFPLSDQDEGTYVYGGVQLVKEKLETEKNDGFIEYRVHCPKCDRILSNSIMDGSELSLTCGKCKSPIFLHYRVLYVWSPRIRLIRRQYHAWLRGFMLMESGWSIDHDKQLSGRIIRKFNTTRDQRQEPRICCGNQGG